MNRGPLLAAGGLVLAAVATAAAGLHPSQLPPLTVDSTFPRCTLEQLHEAGYPDHLHAFSFPGFEVLVDASGETYGPFSLVRGTSVPPRDGLVIEPGRLRYRGFDLHCNPGYEAHQILPMLEMLDWARRDLSLLLGHDRPDTLHVFNPDNLDDYRERTGYAFHRLYRFTDAGVIIEPAPILFARGLAAHAAHHLVALWLMDDLAAGADLPAWLTQGLASYLADDGTHFLNFLAMYRPHQSVIMDAATATALLTAPPDPDDERDKVGYRMAGYAAFLMVWELVENRGGLAPVQALLARVGQGEDPDAVSRELWGATLAELAADLDPTTRPEPVGDAVQPRTPARPPTP